ncbi:MAG: hypothetical protein Q8M39_02860 [Sulfuricurvum sp.]|nr:hypothetical protein [Sulfuricurvum sp.]
MEKWYEKNSTRFEHANELMTVDSTLSELDSHYKRLWDYHNTNQHVSQGENYE